MDWSFLDVFWAICIFFAWVFFFWLLITVFSDLFRRHDIGGGAKTLWVLFVIFLPFLGVFFYLITQGRGMGERAQAAGPGGPGGLRRPGEVGGRHGRTHARRSRRRSSCSTAARSPSPSTRPSRRRRSPGPS